MTISLPDPLAATYGPVALTPAEYDALPPNSRLELVAGVLHATTPATGRHQDIVKCLERALEKTCPRDLRVVREQELRLGDSHRRNPDLMVIVASEYDPDGYSYTPAQVRLAIEVVSPGTETTDRKHKPVGYGDAGVPHYWRVEARPQLTVHTYQLGETGHYLESGLFKEGDTMSAPGLAWAKIVVADLLP